MSCYFRHLKEIFEGAGVKISKENQKIINQKIHEFVGVPYKHCHQSWKRIKERLGDEERKKQLIDYLKRAQPF